MKLAWFAPRKCWKKKRAGKVFYLGDRGVNKSDRIALAKALAEWHAIEAKLDDEAGQAEAKRERADALTTHADLHEAIEMMRQTEDPANPSLGPALLGAVLRAYKLDGNPDFALGKLDPINTAPQAKSGESIGDHAKAFLDFYRLQARTGNRSTHRAAALQYYIGRLLDWHQVSAGLAAQDRAATDINAAFTADYHAHLAGLVIDDKIATATALSTWAAFKQFARWLWERETIELPRNLDSKLLAFTAPPQQIKTLDIPTIKRAIESAPARTRLYTLLALNTGTTSMDIAKIGHAEVNWTTGTLTRKRSKTSKHLNVPTVIYALWPETIKLLRQFKSRNQAHLLATEDGTALVRVGLRTDGKLARVDNIRLAWRRLREKLNAADAEQAKAEGREARPMTASFKTLRKTSATLLDSHPTHRAVTSLWLGHAPAGMREKHYAAPSQVGLDAAIKWLAQQYSLEM